MTSHSDLTVGDVVSLAGTKMKMTVEKIEGEFAGCLWYDRENNLNRYPFQCGILEKHTAPPAVLTKGRRK
jgi:uncharacterized protein YodC (DUF2158 family)